jgi:hypothetical protein
MDKAALVSIDIDRGAQVLDTLDRAGLKLAVALWVHLSEYEDWRLVVSGRKLDSVNRRDGYGLIHQALDPAGFTAYTTPIIMILPMADPFIKGLRRIFAKAKSVEGMRLGGQMIGDRFIEDGYAYRIS